MNINIIFIIIFIILVYLIYIKKRKEKELFTVSETEYNNLLKKYISQKFDLNYQGTRTFVQLCKHFYNKDKLILPLDMILNGNIVNENMTVNGSYIIDGKTQIDNLVVNGNISINKDYRNIYSDDETNSFSFLDILPSGSIIPWMRQFIPQGWAICNGQEIDNITTPNLTDNKLEDKSRYNNDSRYNIGNYPQRIFYEPGLLIKGVNNSQEIGVISGNDIEVIEQAHLPLHNHKLVMNYTQNNKNPTQYGFYINVDEIILGSDDNYIHSTYYGDDPFMLRTTSFPKVKVIYIMKL